MIDLVTVSPFDVNGTSILVPQRVDPEHVERVVLALRHQLRVLQSQVRRPLAAG